MGALRNTACLRAQGEFMEAFDRAAFTDRTRDVSAKQTDRQRADAAKTKKRPSGPRFANILPLRIQPIRDQTASEPVNKPCPSDAASLVGVCSVVLHSR